MPISHLLARALGSSTHLPRAVHHGDLKLAVPIDDLPAPRNGRDALGHDILALRLGASTTHGGCVRRLSWGVSGERTTNERLNGRGDKC